MAPIRLINITPVNLCADATPDATPRQRPGRSLGRYCPGAARAYVTVWWLSSVPSSRTQSATP
jgi:hypothetical protein